MHLLVFPSDCVDPLNVPAEGRLAGRVVHSAAASVTLADDSGAVVLRHQGALPTVGRHVVFEYVRQGAEFSARRLLFEAERGALAPSGEFDRLSQGRGTLLRARSRAARVIRNYFEEERFTEVETPTFVPSPGLDPHVHSLAEVRRGERVDHLITSPEFHMKRLLTGGLSRIYQFARCFRAEELGRVHEPEFTLLEWYRSFEPYESMLEDTEEIICRVFSALAPATALPSRPFRRLTVAGAFREFAPGYDPDRLCREDSAEYYQVFLDAVEPGISALDGPTFLTEFPLPLAALARPSDEDPKVAERFELYFRGVELCNGYGELTDPKEQRARFETERSRRESAGEPVYPLDERFLSALEEGMPPAAGNALGFDRLVALACGLDAIGPTYAFTDSER